MEEDEVSFSSFHQRGLIVNKGFLKITFFPFYHIFEEEKCACKSEREEKYIKEERKKEKRERKKERERERKKERQRERRRESKKRNKMGWEWRIFWRQSDAEDEMNDLEKSLGFGKENFAKSRQDEYVLIQGH